MCGRFTIRARPQAIAETFGVAEVPTLFPRYNVAPTQQVLAIRAAVETGMREPVLLRWGLIPSWAKDPSIGSRMINARAETVGTKPGFRQAFAKRRCLVVADGFYEWRKVGAKKQPYFMHRRDDRPFAFAGLWECWGQEKIETCTIVTMAANAFMQPLHERMPVILPEYEYGAWLDPTRRASTTFDGLTLLPDGMEDFVAEPVSTLVNSPKNEVPDCIRTIEIGRARDLFDD